MADVFTPFERNRIEKMEEFRTLHPRKAYWQVGRTPSYSAQKAKQLMVEWDNYVKHGQRVGKPKPPETWLTRRRAFMARRYSKTPEGGFSGALGGAAVQRKKLLGA